MRIGKVSAIAGLVIMAMAPVPPALAQDAPPPSAAETALRGDYDRFVAELTTITQIAAPPFAEGPRAEHVAQAFRRQGLADVAIDAEGNVTALRRGSRGANGPLLVVCAHLDTVFPAGTDLAVQRSGVTLTAPGIGDDTLGLAALLAWARALDAAKVATRNDILFVASVGEEGQGDLRGVRHLLTRGPYRDRIAAFIAVDGADPSKIVTRAVGSKRYNISFTGPGGHSYGAFGIVNPMAAMADTVKRLYEIKVPVDPRTTYSASVVTGGTSVNSIPDRVELQVDMRSPDAAELTRLEQRFLAIVGEAVNAENYARSTALGAVAAETVPIGDRPAGATPEDAPLVRAAEVAITAHGYNPERVASSTDANIAMSMGLPAVTIGTGGGGGRAHSVDEYVNIEPNALLNGLATGLDFVIAAANLDLSRR